MLQSIQQVRTFDHRSHTQPERKLLLRRPCRTRTANQMPFATDLYKELGVGEQASDEEIRKAYYCLARKHHPDKNGGSEDATSRFKAITEANRVWIVLQKPAPCLTSCHLPST